MDIRRAFAEWFAHQPEFEQWAQPNTDAYYTYEFYESANAHISTLLYSLDILWPNFIERDGMILRDRGQTEEEWERWLHIAPTLPQIEFLNNHLHAWDTFTNDPLRNRLMNDLVNGNTEGFELWQRFWQHYAETVAEMWRCRLKQLFPDKNYIVEVYEGYGPEITVYTPRPDDDTVAPAAPDV